MIVPEFKSQRFKTRAQWQSGLLYRLNEQADNGITLYGAPVFKDWIQALKGQVNIVSLAVDECRQLYLLQKDDSQYRFYRCDPAGKSLERLGCISGSGSNPGEISDPGRILVDHHMLWILDQGNQRIQAFNKENFQIIYIIDSLEAPIDMAFDGKNYLFVLDQKTRQIFKYDHNGVPAGEPFGNTQLKDKEPIGLVAGSATVVCAVAPDEGLKCGFMRFSEEGNYLDIVGEFAGIFQGEASIHSQGMALNSEASIFVAFHCADTCELHKFSPDGSHLGKVTLPDSIKSIKSIACDGRNHLFLSTDQGIAHLSPDLGVSGAKGVYYSRTLDSGPDEGQWHRLKLEAALPQGAGLEVYYASSGDRNTKRKVDAIFTETRQSLQQKVAKIESLLTPGWIGPEKFLPNPAGDGETFHDMLFREKTKRYLWLKLVLSSFDQQQRPVVNNMTVFYPRHSYLRYLPAVYQEDPVSRDFLERFLSLFETVLYGLENEISQIYRYFDPDTTPVEFFAWLSSWLNLSLEEGWPAQTKQQFILKAANLFRRKGTPQGLADFIEIVTGQRPIIWEHSLMVKPLVLSGRFPLGCDTFVTRTPPGGFVLGQACILGHTAIRANAPKPEDPFLPLAHCFTVLLNMDRSTFQSYQGTLKRILDAEKPAHTHYTLGWIGEPGTGQPYYVGINSFVKCYRHFRLGVTSVVGKTVAFSQEKAAAKIDNSLSLTKGFQLI
ncbi:hypothetical protein D1BOALGB6SA_7207 [Olavius sp. associated proteobacterium Delta 1]|nr:hypothetical protein D1BOALGB6SA_7207 [Olavius sp. associated proteobacterium Delta 1]